MKNLVIFGSIILVLLIGGIYLFTSKKPVTQKTQETVKPTAQPTKAADNKTFALEDVAKHGEKTDCWMAINGSVYDVTPFIDNHPGGAIIATGCGKDASILFNLRPNTKKAPHPEQANEGLKKLYVGKLKSS